MVIEPLSLDEEHIKFFMLAFVQPLLDNLEFIGLDNLVLSAKSSLASSIANLVLLVFRTD